MARTRFRAVLTVGALLLASALVGNDLASGAAPHSAPAQKQAFHDAMRKLWEDHITWTRLTIVSFAAELPDLEPTLGRLLQNQTDLGDAISPFYGEAAGAALTGLLRDHIFGAVDILVAAKAGDQVALAAALAAWYSNGEEIADFLHQANPRFWPQEEMRSMMREHLDLTLAMAAARLEGEFEADIAIYEEVHEQVLEMADMLSAGIIRQFPEKFGGR
jgi:hypothetical protein